MRIQRLHHRVQLTLLVASCLVALLAVRARWRGQEPVEQGMRLVSEGDYVPAARALARAVALAPRDARAHYYLGLAYAGMGRSEASVNHLEEAVQLRPGDARFHDALGQAYRRAGDSARALLELEKAVWHGPATARYQLDLAGALLEEGRLADALASLRRLERGEPRSPAIRLLLADALRRAGDRMAMEKEYREAIRLADGTALGELARQHLRAASVAEDHPP